MFNQAIRTVGTGFIITAWLFAATRDPRATEFACIGLGLFISGVIWPVTEKMNSNLLRGLGVIGTEIWKIAGRLFNRKKVQKAD